MYIHVFPSFAWPLRAWPKGGGTVTAGNRLCHMSHLSQLHDGCHGMTSLPPLHPPLATSDCLRLHSASSASTLLLPPPLCSNSDAYLCSSYDYIAPTLR